MLDSSLGAKPVDPGSSGNEGVASFESEMLGSSGMEGNPSGFDSMLGNGSFNTGKAGEEESSKFVVSSRLGPVDAGGGEMSTEGKATEEVHCHFLQ